jgi:hypothetical protein
VVVRDDEGSRGFLGSTSTDITRSRRSLFPFVVSVEGFAGDVFGWVVFRLAIDAGGYASRERGTRGPVLAVLPHELSPRRWGARRNRPDLP